MPVMLSEGGDKTAPESSDLVQCCFDTPESPANRRLGWAGNQPTPTAGSRTSYFAPLCISTVLHVLSAA